MAIETPDDYAEFYESFANYDKARQMSVEDVASALEKGRRVVFIDARRPEEQAVSTIEGALPIDVQKSPFELTVEDCEKLVADLDLPQDEDALVVSYCTAGIRGELCALAVERGHGRSAYNLTGGLIEWKNSGLPVKQPDGADTDKLHPCIPELNKYIK